jgi:hypothetical protein
VAPKTARQLSRLAGAAGVLLVPMVLLLAELLIRVDSLTALRLGRASAVDLNLDVETVVRWATVAGLLAVAAVVGWAPVWRHRRAGSR